MRPTFLCTILATLAAAGPASAQTAAQMEQYRDMLVPVLECHVAELVTHQMQLCGRVYPALASRAQRAGRVWSGRNGDAAAERASACAQRLAAMSNRLEAEATRASMDAVRKTILETSATAIRSGPESCTVMFDDVESGRGNYEVKRRPQ